MYPIFAGNGTAAAVFLSAYLLWAIMELTLGRSRQPGSDARVQDRRSGWAVLAGIWLAEALGWAGAFGAPALAIAGPRVAVFAAGMLLAVTGMALRWYSVQLLGQHFTMVVATHPGQAVVDRGVYGAIRHPSYAGSLLTIIGFGIAFANWISLAAAIVAPSLAYAYRIAVEEKALLAALGDEYRTYMKRTKRIIPFVI